MVAGPGRQPVARGVKSLCMGLALATALSACNSLPVPKPAIADTEPRSLEELERSVQPVLAQARATYPDAKRRFLAGLPQGARFYVSVKLRDPAGRLEQAYVFVATYQGSTVLGRIASQVDLIAGYAVGDPYAGPESDILDWVIIHADGSEEGKVVGKFLQQRQ